MSIIDDFLTELTQLRAENKRLRRENELLRIDLFDSIEMSRLLFLKSDFISSGNYRKDTQLLRFKVEVGASYLKNFRLKEKWSK